MTSKEFQARKLRAQRDNARAHLEDMTKAAKRGEKVNPFMTVSQSVHRDPSRTIDNLWDRARLYRGRQCPLAGDSDLANYKVNSVTKN